MSTYKNNLFNSSITRGIILLSITFLLAVILGLVLGHLNNMNEIENLLETKRPSLPSKLFDRNGEIITIFYSDEKKDLITLDIVPEYLVQGLILWEDESFYHHKGFNIFAIIRAALNNIIGKPISGASTLTQQLSRTLFLTSKFSWNRKFRELWLSIQLEKKYTKNELLTLYLNHVPLGFGINGIGAAAKFYFDKDIKELDYAESASLISLISNPTLYSFIRFPKNHKQKQKQVLNKMVKNGIITDIEAENSFNNFWLKWQSTAHTSRGAFFNREDFAPFFSDWVMNIINDELPNINIFKDGLNIYSTLDVKWNIQTAKLMKNALKKQQKIFEDYQLMVYNTTQNLFYDSIALLSNTFSLYNINVNRNTTLKRSITDYNKDINPSLNLLSQSLGLNVIDTVTEIMFDKEDESKELLSEVEGAFIVLDNDTGQILVMVGGNKFDPNNRFNYAMQSLRQPGSSFKPLVYSAALDTKTFTAGSIILDEPYVFSFDSEDPLDWYIPYNYGGKFHGRINLRRALRKSLNIPSCKIFYTIGKNNNYKVPIDRAAMLLGLKAQSEINERFKPEISTVLGTGSVSPAEMATAFAVFANQGRRVIPNSILYIDDRDGNVIYEPWKELEKYYLENKSKLQLISPQNAFIITDILKDVVNHPEGTLAFVKQRLLNEGKNFPNNVDFAAKSGTTQNWSDAWVIGFSKKITAAGWIGFDKYGLSLGYNQAGASVVGPVWLEFMREYHENMNDLKFEQPDGVFAVQICRKSGLRPSKYCNPDDLYYEYFLPDTIPNKECNYCKMNNMSVENNLQSITKKFDKSTFKNNRINSLIGDTDIKVDKSILSKFKSNDTNIDIDDELINIDLYKDDFDIQLDDIDIDTELNLDKNNEKDNTTDETKIINNIDINKINDNTNDSSKVLKSTNIEDSTSDNIIE